VHPPGNDQQRPGHTPPGEQHPQGLPPVALENVNRSQYGVADVVHRNVPGWNRDEHQLYRGDGRSPEEIRADGGFRPPYMSQADWRNDPQRAVADIAQHVGGNTNAFVSTSTDRRVGEHFAISRYNYVINAPGGIYTDPTLQKKTGKESHGEQEVLFPGGIDWRYVKGWHKMSWDPGEHDYVAGEFVPNPDYVGDRATPSGPADGARPDRYGPSTQDATRTGEPTERGSSPVTEQHDSPRPGSLGDRMGRLDDPRLDALRPHLQSTEGGMSAFAPPRDASGKWAHDNEMYTARQVPKIPGQFVVDMHGSPDGVRIGDTPLSEKDVADLIRANPDYDGRPVTLFGCRTGDGFAARVAQELGAPVTAPNSDAWVDHNGNVFASGQAFNPDIGKPAKPVWPPNGEWSTHTPDGDQTVHNGPYPPGHTPTWGEDTPSRPAGVAAHRGDDPSVESPESGGDDSPDPTPPHDGVPPDSWDDGDPADVMQQMVDRELTAMWANFAYDNREFQEWCQTPPEAPLPEIRPDTRINCWEMTMYAAVVSGELSHAEANRIYDFANTMEGRDEWFQQLPDRLSPERHPFDPGGPPPGRGELVFWDGSSHVAMTTGRMVDGSPEVYTFWPPPDTPFDRTPEGWATQDRVKTSTIQVLSDFMNSGRDGLVRPLVVVEVGPPVWGGES
jgi:hypothetical protein